MHFVNFNEISACMFSANGLFALHISLLVFWDCFPVTDCDIIICIKQYIILE